MALFGQSSGPVPPFDPNILNGKGSLFLTRPSLGHYVPDARGAALARRRRARAGSTSGKLKLRIDRTYPLAEAAPAHRDLEGRKTAGKLLLTVAAEVRMNLQAKLTLGYVLLAVVIVSIISVRRPGQQHAAAVRGHAASAPRSSIRSPPSSSSGR